MSGEKKDALRDLVVLIELPEANISNRFVTIQNP